MKSFLMNKLISMKLNIKFVKIKMGSADSKLKNAIENDEINKVQKLLQKGFDINKGINKEHNTCLIYASYKNRLEIVRFLLEKGADVNACNNEGFTALMYASRNNNFEVVCLLLEKGANVNKYNFYNCTALLYASYNNNLELFRLIIKTGANVNKYDSYKNTALMITSQNNNLEMVRLLLQQEADVNICNSKGFTALDLAIKKGHYKIIEVLLEAGAGNNINDINKYIVSLNGLLIKNIKNATLEVQLAAVKQNGDAIKFIENPNEIVIKIADKNNNSNYKKSKSSYNNFGGIDRNPFTPW